MKRNQLLNTYVKTDVTLNVKDDRILYGRIQKQAKPKQSPVMWRFGTNWYTKYAVSYQFRKLVAEQVASLLYIHEQDKAISRI